MKKNSRGGIGFILILISLLISGFLVFQNMKKTGEVIKVDNAVTGSPQQILEHFQDESKKIEKMQQQHLPDPHVGE